MRKQLLGLGLATGVLAGSGVACGGENESSSEGSTAQSAEERGCIEINEKVSLERATRFVIDSCQYLGQTEFQDGDSSETDMFLATLVDPNGAILDCIISASFDSDGGVSTNCNWDNYNDQARFGRLPNTSTTEPESDSEG
jgi:hypothetical protein